MYWYSDSYYTRSGYVICLLTDGDTTIPAPTFTTGLWDAATMTGPCELDSDGCWTDGAGTYGNNERCSICTRRSGYVSAVGVFDTEGGSYDYLTISGNNYGGDDEPDNVYIISNGCINWRSDSSVTRDGWSLCEDGTRTTAGTAVGGSTSDDDDDSSFPWGAVFGVFFVIIIVVAIAQQQKQARKQARAQQDHRTPAYQNGAFVAPKPVVTPWAAPTVAASASPYKNVAATGRAPTTTEYKAATTIQAGYRGHAVRKKMSQPRRSKAFGNRKPAPRTFATNGKFDVPVVQVDTGDPFGDLGDPFAAAMTDMETLDNYSSRNQGGYPNSHLIPRSSDAVVPAYRPPPKPWLTAPY
jgi:hypothetical protein